MLTFRIRAYIHFPLRFLFSVSFSRQEAQPYVTTALLIGTELKWVHTRHYIYSVVCTQ